MVEPAIGTGSKLVPTRKVGGGAVFGGTVGIILVWTLNTFVIGDPAKQIPGEIASAIGTLCSFVVAWLISDR